jgi:hypothetical protein
MKRVLFVVAMLVFVQGYVLASEVTTFKNGTTEGIANLAAPSYSDEEEMTLPVECYIMKATMDVSGVPPNETNPDSPENVSVYLNDTLLWRYDGPDYGAFGMQDSFINDTGTWTSQFNSSGGLNSTKIRLPKRAMVQNASFEVDCDGPWNGLVQELNVSGTGRFGVSISDAGDVNNDGYGDIIIGADTFNTTKGAAYIYFGGPVINNIPDLILNGEATDDYFGCSVSGAGDVNNDGFDDVIVGAFLCDAGGTDAGRAYIYYGGTSMDSTADITLTGGASEDYFGEKVSGAGDLNGDGYDDVIVGARGNDTIDYDAGAAYIYFGAASMHITPDLSLFGFAYEDLFGICVSGAGDVNNDGYSDVIVGANQNDTGGNDAGSAYIYLGGASMDNTTDVVFYGGASMDLFGSAVSDAGDVNNDGFDDVIIGAWWNGSAGYVSGSAYIYFGKASMDSTADVVMTGTATGDYFGLAVSSAGDLNKDGYDDVIVSAYGNDSFVYGCVRVFFGGASMNNISDMTFNGVKQAGYFGWSLSDAGDINGDGSGGILIGSYQDANKAYIYESAFGIKQPQVFVGQTLVWNMPWYYDGTDVPNNFANMLNVYISSNYANGSDNFGNTYIDVPVKAIGKSAGSLTLSKLKIVYQCTQPILEFTDTLSAYLTAHSGEKGADGNITIPFKVTSATPGSVKLDNLYVLTDEAPKLLSQIPDFEMDEDSMQSDQINLREYFSDDYDSIDNIQFSLVSYTNESVVFVELLANGFLSIDAATGPTNDNWTGTVEILVNASDRWGSTTFSNMFKVIIKNVPDPPEITSQPNLIAVPGEQYVYNVTAVDGDNETLEFSLPHAPQNMTIDSALGNISWLPASGGKFDISISVTDGNFTVFQNYTINIPNRLPWITNTTVPEALVETPFDYLIPAVDDDGDTLKFSFVTPVLGMSLDPSTGLISWTPAQSGTYNVSVAISDGKDTLTYDFCITVRQPNRAPRFTSNAITTATAEVQYVYTPTATDDDRNELTFTLVSGPTGMTIENSTGRVLWTPSDTGDFSVAIKVSDGFGGEARQDFTIRVSEPVPPKITVMDPSFNDKWSGNVTISGTVKKGTREVVTVQVRVDSGNWKDASGNYSWSFVLDTKPLKNGKHTLSTRAYDGKVYSDLTSDTFTVSNAAEAKTDYTMWIIIVVVVLAIAAAIGAGVAMSRRKKPPAETEPAPEEEEEPEECEENEEKEQDEEEAEEEGEEEEAEEKEDEEEAEEEPEEKPVIKVKKK